jgi:peptidoglycan hydrolase FlgJ
VKASMDPSVVRPPAGETQVKATREKKRLKASCQEFESFMTGYMLKSMRATVMRAEEPDQARQVYESMMDETLAREMSKTHSNGLADLLYRQLEPLLKKGPSKTG